MTEKDVENSKPVHLPQTVSGDALRDTVSAFPTGITVITTTDKGRDIGLTVSSFSSLSLDPALVSFSLAHTSSKIDYFQVGTQVGISVLADHQGQVARQFSRHGVDRFAGVGTWRNSGAALIADAAAWFDGEIVGAFPGGDHTVFTVAVLACDSPDDARPLLYQRGRMSAWAVEYSI